MCRCSPKGIKECDEVLERARAIVGETESEYLFIDRMLYWLSGSAWEVTIQSDQWARVIVVPNKHVTEDYPLRVRERASIQCDSIVDGIAAAVVFFHEEPEA